MNQIGIFFGEGYEEIEALTVVDICRRAGVQIQMISITGDLMVTGSHQIPVKMDQLMEKVDFDSLSMIVLPGGMPGTKNLEANEQLMHHVDAFFQNGKYVAAICAAPSILGHRGILQGKKACCYPGFEDQLRGAEVNMEEVNVEGKVITGRGMGCAIPFALQIVAVLKGEEAAKEIAKGIIYRA